MHKTDRSPLILFIALALVASSCVGPAPGTAQDPPRAEPTTTATAVFAGGCFWCMEAPFDELEGVVSTVSGYTGGRVDHPTYEQVSAGGTGHAEAVLVTYDPSDTSYEKLLEVFWHNIDPTVRDRQFCDRGNQYRSGIFFADEEQQRLANQSKTAIEKTKTFSAAIVTEISKASEFFPAEEYHQDFYRKSPLRYRSYRQGCGRDRRLAELWGSAAGH